MEQELRRLIEDANESVKKTDDAIVRLESAMARVDRAIEMIDHSVSKSNQATSKLNKILNTTLIILGIILMPAIYAFVDTRDLAMNAVPKDTFQESTDKFYQTFVQSQDALLVHQLEHDWVRTQFYKITKDDIYSVGGDDQVKQIIKAFFTDPHRGLAAETKE